MKKVYVRYLKTIEFTPVYKEYPEYGVSITKNNYNDLYVITDIKTGLGCGKSFKKLKDAKSFMEDINKANFRNWFRAIEKARNTEMYKKYELPKM